MEESITWVGIDAHKKSLQFAVMLGDQFRQWEIANESKAIRRAARKLVRQAWNRSWGSAAYAELSISRGFGGSSPVEPDEPPRRKPWAWLLSHVFVHDVSVCPRCQGPTTWLEVATEPDAIHQAMADHGMAPHRARPPPLPRLPPDAQLALPL